MSNPTNSPSHKKESVAALNDTELDNVQGGIVTADLQDWVRKNPADLISASSYDEISSGKAAAPAEGKTKKG